MKKIESPVQLRMAFDKVKAVAMDSFESTPTTAFLGKLGISMDEADAYTKYIMDGMPSITEGSPVAAAQFLQHWMPTAIEVITQARMADDLFGRTVCGAWEDESIIQPIVEYTGRPGVYGDATNVPYADFNQTLEDRTIVRFEEALFSGKLEDARTAASNLKKSAHDLKRKAVAKAFAICQNELAFYGFNDGTNKTYGILNDPNLLPYETATYSWATATFAQLIREINTMVSTLRTQTGSNIDPQTTKMTLAIASSRIDFLGTANECSGKTVEEWLMGKFKGLRVKSVPEFDNAHGGTNVCYLYLNQLDGAPVIEQLVVSTMRLLGVEPKAKGLKEVYSNALAGVLVAQPLGVVRTCGI